MNELGKSRNGSEICETGSAAKTGAVRPDMSVEIAGVPLKNPAMTASGTFGSGMEYPEFVDLNKLGAEVMAGVANVRWQ